MYSICAVGQQRSCHKVPYITGAVIPQSSLLCGFVFPPFSYLVFQITKQKIIHEFQIAHHSEWHDELSHHPFPSKPPVIPFSNVSMLPASCLLAAQQKSIEQPCILGFPTVSSIPRCAMLREEGWDHTVLLCKVGERKTMTFQHCRTFKHQIMLLEVSTVQREVPTTCLKRLGKGDTVVKHKISQH